MSGLTVERRAARSARSLGRRGQGLLASVAAIAIGVTALARPEGVDAFTEK